jgi:hypothetical protein
MFLQSLPNIKKRIVSAQNFVESVKKEENKLPQREPALISGKTMENRPYSHKLRENRRLQ